MIGKRTITHCIFDMDGLLLDTEQIYTKVTQAILDKHVPGKTFTWDVKARIMGMTSLESGRIVVDTYQLPLSVEDYLEEAAVMQELMWPEVPLLPGVERLLRHLHASGIPMVVATSSTREKFELKTTKHRELFSLFASVTCGDDPEIRRGKPAPDIFLVAREKLGNPPLENCLIFEDAFMGLQAAKAAGMACVWVPDERILEIVGRDHGAAAIYRSMLEFDAVKFGIPSMGIIWRASNFLIPETETEPQINSQPTALIILNQAISNKKLFEAAWAKGG
ncbi:HAD-like domain-containing protein [Phlyctochytrium arcticum]|nr:HAD-like domain-containing protein [Phlyctochytrium arcticum]